MNKLNIYKKINQLRVDFKNSNIIKSGENKFQRFKYLELKDFIPTIIELNNKYGLYTHISIVDNLATLEVVNCDAPIETLLFKVNVPKVDAIAMDKDKELVLVSFNNKVQDTGKLETYIRRYLYMLYCEIAVDDEIDKTNNRSRIKPKNVTENKTKNKVRKPTPNKGRFVNPNMR